MPRRDAPDDFWTGDPALLLTTLATSTEGLASAEAADRRAEIGPNIATRTKHAGALRLLVGQFANPITILLLGASVLSVALGEGTDGGIILLIVVVSAMLGFWQEHRAAGAVEQLLAMLRTTTNAVRDGREREVPVEEIVPGDVVRLAAGAEVPGDGRVLEARDLFVDQAPLTGESFPAAKDTAATPADAPMAARSNAVWLGTHVVSGTATVLVVRTGLRTQVGGLADRLAARAPLTEFENGVRRFGGLLLNVALLLGLVIFAVNVALDRPVLESFLFTLALVIGLTPQLLPAIVSVTLAYGAHRMARSRVIVRRLSAIEDLGGMAILCTDKTGTITEGVVRVHDAEDWTGAPSAKARLHAALNAMLESGFRNPIDEALRRDPPADAAQYRKVDEVPYDFVRKRLSVAVVGPDAVGRLLLTKGAVSNVLETCETAEDAASHTVPLREVRAAIDAHFEQLSARGMRCLGVAWRALPDDRPVERDAERGMTFAGFLVVDDPLKADARASLDALEALGIRLALVTGDNRYVAANVAEAAGLDVRTMLTGGELHLMDEAALVARAQTVGVFAEVEPSQKERIIRALKRSGRAVGYLGDGINDAAALHAADVGISVDTATDVTKQAADIVLLEKDLAVLARGVQEGRRAFANTLKYVCITTSANFGNMVSMAAASLVVPFLPLLPKQILVNNVLSDLPAMAIATDHLDPEMVAEPRRWDTTAIRRFMVAFGLVSSAFDAMTFGTLLALRVAPATFRTAWFLESLLTELVILLVIRTRRPALRSRPSAPMLWGVAGALAVAAVLVVWTPAARVTGFVPLTSGLTAAVLGIVVAYALASEVTKRVMLGRLPL
ncbi:MAG: magnesium-translocating P-type ATPase [Gemmatimonadaceae bacterium]